MRSKLFVAQFLRPMVDPPLVVRAENTLALARKPGLP